MVYSSQMGSINPAGMKKKKNRYAPMIQEQARAGTATNLVAAAKENKQYKEEQKFKERQAQIQQEQFDEQMSQMNRQRELDYTTAGVSTALQIISMLPW